MISFKDATSLQKNIIFSILKSILKKIGCEANYRFHQGEESLMIRESTLNPPTQMQRIILRLSLRKNPFFTIKMAKIKVIGHLEQISIPTFFLHKINENLTNEFIEKIAKLVVKKPDDIDDIMWAHLPDEITLRWNRFSVSMKKHLIECMAVDLPNLFSKMADQDPHHGLGKTFISPIGLSAPSFPVRLPSSASQAEKVYDLLEVLAIQDRDPSDTTRRCHPLTPRVYFSLHDVLPASDALAELKKRAEKAIEDDLKKDVDNTVPDRRVTM